MLCLICSGGNETGSPDGRLAAGRAEMPLKGRTDMREIPVETLQMNPMSLISEEWMLITAGDEKRGYNTMTAAWGHLGAIWGHGKGLPTAVVYIRPQRYTREFVDREPLFSLSFFPRSYRKQLQYLGSHSGRDEDKVAKAGLTPAFGDGFTYFAESSLVMVCRKLYRGEITADGFVDAQIIEDNYPLRDFHVMYIGEIVKVLEAESGQK
ncbi:flavin reductase family protein [Jonquetella anthropi]|nr:flavin reductase [Jonquetella anthropi]EEX48886.1 hypothetical protein GCWU000246_00610 [Jonquetella anthropi E3_33 E1]